MKEQFKNAVIDRLKKYRNIILLLVDMLFVAFAYFFSHLLIEGRQFFLTSHFDLASFIIVLVIHFASFEAFQLYRIIWRYATPRQILMCVLSEVIAEGASLLIISTIFHWLSYAFFGVEFVVITWLLVFSRMIYIVIMAYGNSIRKTLKHKEENDTMRTLIVGAGAATKILLLDMSRNDQVAYKPICLVDDDAAKQHRVIGGIKVCGKIADIPALCKQYHIEAIILSILSISTRRKKEILSICAQTDCIIKKVPSYQDFVEMKDNISNGIQNINIDDLLGRDPIHLENKQLIGFIGNKVVMVTGGGGSIGSELCRQIAALSPKRLIILDIYENNAYAIQQELIRKYGEDLDLKVEIASVRDVAKMQRVMQIYHPEIVYHAAAHKHVPLMEHNPEEAVKNNIIGTYNTARIASESGVKRFVLVSTDKAVNPTNIMGATKRCCEMVVQSMNTISQTEFVAVRFGNVLGSNGSVIPLFEKQIQAGGPVTVTHPDIIRYFMTIPEAVQLLLSAGSMAKGGEIFVLDMGDPVKILDLAKNLIRMSGHVPGKDIQIEFTGLRPGEKLYEELLLDDEGIKKTDSAKIFIGSPIKVDQDKFYELLQKIKAAANQNDKAAVAAILKELVPTYHHNKEDDVPAETEMSEAIL